MIRLNDTIRGKESLERTLFEMATEMQSTRAKVDAQSMDLVTTAKQLKDKSEKLEEENKNAVNSLFVLNSVFLIDRRSKGIHVHNRVWTFDMQLRIEL